MMFFSFPEDITISVLTTWIGIKDVAHLDSACCNRKQRLEFLKLLKDGRVVFDGFQQQNTQFLKFCKWITKRRISLKNFHIPEYFAPLAHKYMKIIAKAILFSQVENLSLPEHINSDYLTIATFELSRVKLQMKRVKTLTFRFREGHFMKNKNDSSLVRIAENCSQLEQLDISQCTLLTDAGLERITKGCPMLKSLNISKCIQITETGLKSSIARLPLLTSLKLGYKGDGSFECSTSVTDSVIRIIAQNLPMLKELYISESHKITDSSMVSIAEGCSQLEVLDISFCEQITDVGLKSIAGGCAMLKSLNADSCNNSGLINNISRLSLLQSLNLSRSGATDAVVEIIVQNLLLLTDLNISLCDNVTESSLASIAGSIVGLQLKVLICGGSHKNDITDTGLISIAKTCSQLEVLDINYCQLITDISLESIAEGCPMLKSLSMEGAPITDAGVKSIAEGCPMLNTLEIGDCRYTGDSGLESISKLTYLRRLNLEGCNDISDEGISYLNRLFFLEDLDLCGCFISNSDLKMLATSSSRFKVLNLDFNRAITYAGVALLLASDCCSTLKVIWIGVDDDDNYNDQDSDGNSYYEDSNEHFCISASDVLKLQIAFPLIRIVS
jgi:F-box/leucine-rich repeat protein 2/20